MIFLIMLGANIFGYFLAVTGISHSLAGFLAGMEISKYVILIIIMVIYVILGMFMDTMAMILITVPIFYPVIMQLGFDPIWFGILLVTLCEVGMITPPVGMNLYVIAGISGGVPMGRVFKGAVPFIVADLVHNALLVALPAIVLFVPDLLG